jgi:hypothetical protein
MCPVCDSLLMKADLYALRGVSESWLGQKHYGKLTHGYCFTQGEWQAVEEIAL